ncbi:hypothetical protein K3722_04675 [Leisingera caerulea]|uniref:AMIN domain-containing protein n=1 Tax=Leisingera caerulea TaxID=506591 RepID=A0ABY5WZ80_LEICA|nr:hypothetical protein [Leisingera caerulea]UWQ59423.1 hypothetical protein K3722_04675 [Leisingera caerulea]
MMPKALILIFIFICFPSLAVAERANLSIQTYGLNPDSDWRFDVKIIAGANQLERPAEYTQQPTNFQLRPTRSGVQVRLSNVFFPNASSASLISLVAYQADQSGKRTIELFFPVHKIDVRVTNGANVTFDKVTMTGTTNSSLAARRSFPLKGSDGQSVRISNRNLVTALNAVREIARRPELNSTVWGEIFLAIQTNTSLIAQRNDVLRKIVDILNEYKEVNETDAFARFYLLFLRKMVLEELGETIRLNDTALINDYFRDEVSALALSNPKVAYAEMNEMLSAFEKAKNYERCIRVAQAFQEGIKLSVISDPDWWFSQSSRILAAEIYNGLIGGTRCAQLSYVEADDKGSRSDAEGGAKYTVNTMLFGSDYATSFVEMVAAFKEKQILSMRHEEIEKYNFFYNQETKKALGL